MPRGISNFAPQTAALGLPHPIWYGGHVMEHVKIVQVVYGAGTYHDEVTNSTAPNFPSFYDGVTHSKYFDWMSEYSAGGEVIGRGSFAGRFTITPAAGNNGATIDDADDIQPELFDQIEAQHLPAPDADTLYVVHFPAEKTITLDGADNIHDFCAYHSTEVVFSVATSTNETIRYAVIPDNAGDSDCGDSAGFGNMTSVTSHEITEAVTDPDVGLATDFAPPLAWYDEDYGEVSDICVGFQDTLKGGDGRAYVVQQNWSNQANDCITAGTTRTISVGDASIMEGDAGARSLKFPVTLSAPSNATVTVKYQLHSATATGGSRAAGIDFNNAGGTLHTLTFSKNSTTGITPVKKDVVVPVYGDSSNEADESFTVTLSNASAGYGIADGEGVGKVIDDDPKLDTTTIGVGGLRIHRGLQGNRRLYFPITLSHTISKSVKVKWSLRAGTAKLNADYGGPTSGTATISANSIGTSVGVLVYAKSATSDRSFTITIGTSSTPLPPHTKFSRTSATGTILRG